MTHKVENAVILAAGKGERMFPLTVNTPKPLLKVNGKPIIENTIEALLSKEIRQIFVVVGYLAEQFQYLTEKYGVKIVFNENYNTCNNISSLYAVREYLGNSVIMDADIWIENTDVIQNEFDYSGYTSIRTEEYSPEWIQYVNEDGFLLRCTRGGKNGWILYSISYWSKEDCEQLKQDMNTEYIERKNTQIYWDDIPIFCYPEHYKLQIKKASAASFTEFDNPEELAAYDKSYLKYLQK